MPFSIPVPDGPGDGPFVSPPFGCRAEGGEYLIGY